MRPRNAGEHTDVAALVEAEAAGAARDLRDLPRLEVAALLAVELLRLGEEQRLARQVHAVPDHVGRRAHLGGARDEAVDLLAPRRERHRAVEHGDAARMQLVQLAGEPDHRAAAERDDDGARPETGDAALAEPVERRLALEEAQLGVRERVLDERQRLDRAEQQDVPVLAAEHQPRPRRAALLVLGPLHLVEHERLAVHRRHLGGAADDRRVGVDALLAGDEADAVLAELGGEPAVRLLREHPQRRRVDAAAVLDEEAQRVVRLAGVRRAEVRDHRLRLGRPLRQADGQLGDRLPRRLALRLMAVTPAGPLLSLVSPRHGATVSTRWAVPARGAPSRAPRRGPCAGRRRHGSSARPRRPRCSGRRASCSGRP